MASGGYMGRILSVDLGSGEARTMPLEPALARDFIGGLGFSVRLAYDLLPPGVDPLGPDNVIVFGVSPLTGTLAPGAARFSVTTKFPLSNTIGGANGGVRLGAQIKLAGYDAVVITGRAPLPVYLSIEDEVVTLRPAGNLWGKDIYETTEALWAEHGGEVGVLAIGQAGEHQSKHALALTDKIAATGRGGLGAVMGSKNLKAVVARGSHDVTVADTKRFMKAVNHYYQRIGSFALYNEWIDLGMQRTWQDTMRRPGFVRRMGTELADKEETDRIAGVGAYRRCKKANFACFGCPMADKEIVEIKEDGAEGRLLYTSSFSSKVAAYSTAFDLHSTAEALQCMEAANRFGLDSQSLVQIMDQVIYYYEQGLITAGDTGGVALRRDFDTVMLLLRWTAFREGLGAVLSEGMDQVCRHFGRDPAVDSAAIKGWGSFYDPRVTGLGTMQFEMLVNPRGGCHTSGGSPAYARGAGAEKFALHARRMGAPEESLSRLLDAELGFNTGRLTRYSEDWYAVMNALGMCVRTQINRFHGIGSLAELYSAATGIEIAPSQLAEAGARIWNLLRSWSAREGFSRKDDRPPATWFRTVPVPDGDPLRLRLYFGQTIDRAGVERLLDDYYDERGWDQRSGLPTAATLGSLGLDWVREDLRQRGVAVS